MDFRPRFLLLLALLAPCAPLYAQAAKGPKIGAELAVPQHLANDQEFNLPINRLIAHGKLLFNANWTSQEGAGRPQTKGTGKPLSDPSDPLIGARAFNRISGPDANSCAGCHNQPHGHSGGGGDFVTNVFLLGQRFDFVTMQQNDAVPLKGSVDERGQKVDMHSVANLRATTGMFGAGYLEMLARQITTDLQRIRDRLKPGQSLPLTSKGISFGTLSRTQDGLWDVSAVTGLSRLSLISSAAIDPPTLIIRPWHQAGNVISLREFSNTAFNQHHGLQSTERFGWDSDPDGDGFVNELTRADITAISLYQAALPVPGRVIPRVPEIEAAVLRGEALFTKIGCATCHRSELPLDLPGLTYSEPNPFNPPGNLQLGDARTITMDLASDQLPSPRFPRPSTGNTLLLPVYTDFKLHDITSGPGDPNNELLNMNFGPWSPKFSGGNQRFLTKRLWGAANEPPYFHHGLFTTLRQAVLAHSGEALDSRRAFESLPELDRDSLIEFLKSLQVLPPGTKHLIVDENFEKRDWPPAAPLLSNSASSAPVGR